MAMEPKQATYLVPYLKWMELGFQVKLMMKNIASKSNLALNRPRESQQMAFAVPIFSEGFALTYQCK